MNQKFVMAAQSFAHLQRQNNYAEVVKNGGIKYYLSTCSVEEVEQIIKAKKMRVSEEMVRDRFSKFGGIACFLFSDERKAEQYGKEVTQQSKDVTAEQLYQQQNDMVQTHHKLFHIKVNTTVSKGLNPCFMIGVAP